MADLSVLFNELIRFEQELWNAVDAELRERHDLPLSKFEPLRVIASTEHCRVHDVAAALVLTTGGTSKLIDTLAASGYCVRAPNPHDRRSSILRLTPAGRRVLTRAETTFEAVLSELLGSVPEPALERFTACLVGLRGALAVAPSATSTAA